MNRLQRAGGFAALYEAAAYVIGIIGFLFVVNTSGVTDPIAQVAFVAANQTALAVLHLLVYVVWGAMMIVLALALKERLQAATPALAQVAAVFGLLWGGIIIASGMIYNSGMDTAVALYAQNPEQAATVWLAVESVYTGLGGGNEIVGGIWVLLLSVAALRSGALPRLLNYLGLLISAAGLLSVIPALNEIAVMVFGLGQIVWFVWLGIVMLRQPVPAREAPVLIPNPGMGTD